MKTDTQWQPITTAPVDGTAVLGKLPDSDIPHPIKFHDGAWCVAWDLHRLSKFDQPTHWLAIGAIDTTSAALLEALDSTAALRREVEGLRAERDAIIKDRNDVHIRAIEYLSARNLLRKQLDAATKERDEARAELSRAWGCHLSQTVVVAMMQGNQETLIQERDAAIARAEAGEKDTAKLKKASTFIRSLARQNVCTCPRDGNVDGCHASYCVGVMARDTLVALAAIDAAVSAAKGGSEG